MGAQSLFCCKKTLSIFLLFYFVSFGDCKKHKKSHASIYNIYPVELHSDEEDFSYPRDDDLSGRVVRSLGAPIDSQGCRDNELYHMDFDRCGGYYKCKRQDDSQPYIRTNFTCPDGYVFDEGRQDCGDTLCSDLPPYPKVPDGWPECPRHGRKIQVPGDCRKFFVCWWTGSYYTYTVADCGSVYFRATYQTCSNQKTCPQNWYNETGEWGCTQDLNALFPHPDNCNQFFQCHHCPDNDVPREPETPTPVCVEVRDCPKGEVFDVKTKECMKKGKCQPKLNKLPPGYKCDGDGLLTVHPSNCKKFYKCFFCKKKKPEDEDEWCYDKFHSCPTGTFFDNILKTCVNSKICPQDLLELPEEPGYKCSTDGEKNVHPKDCSQYYLCIKCSKGKGWCYDPLRCSMGYLWDDLQKKCTKTDSCPQDWKPLPAEPGWQCETHGEKNQVPNACTEYYTCIRCDRPYKWCYTKHTCSDGQTFDEDIMECVHGRCPQWPEILPTNWTCTEENMLEIDPTDCKKFYSCVKCPDNHPWCFYPDMCPPGLWFDSRQKKCVVRERCPSEDKELPEGWKCLSEGELHVWPEDCRKYYECYRCSYPRGWCIEENICPSGETFDDILDMCVLGKCPQNKTELPKGPGWHCMKNGELNVVPGKGNCSRYYECEVCSKPGGWCYTEHECGKDQNFNDETKTCVNGRCPQEPEPIPEKWNCTKNGELNAYPEIDDCDSYYECIWTGEYYTWTNHDCPSGLYFDNIAKKCVDPPCPQLLIEIGPEPEWKCTRQGDVTVYPPNCQQWVECYKCSKPRNWCYLEIESCPTGTFFDQIEKVCTPGTICPQNRPEIFGNMTCSMKLEQHVWENDCRRSYICHRCEKPKGFCYEEAVCPPGQTFSEELGRCVPGRCPQLPPKIPDNWNCTKAGEKHVYEKDCSKFYTCIECEDGPWCYNGLESCPKGFTFDEKLSTCVRGRCPQYPQPVPPVWPACVVEGSLNVYPGNCSMYYKCVACPDTMDDWCFTLHECKDGESFDNLNKKCVSGRCRQWPPKLPEGYNCTIDGELEVDPNDCSAYYKCISNCPDADWCFEPKKCASGYNFDRILKACVEGPCPGKLPVLPAGPGWHCGSDEETHVFPDDCSSYYSCRRCLHAENGWCYEKLHCSAGQTFSEELHRCITGRCPQYPNRIPEGVTCKEEGDLHVNPDRKRCFEYFNCTKCPDGGWCYYLETCPGNQNFDDTNKTCIDGKCPQKPVRPPRPERECFTLADAGYRKPDLENCHCWYQCKWYVTYAKWKWHCCEPGYYYDEEIDPKGVCAKGDCPYGENLGQGQRRSGWTVQTFVLGK